jgi:hypothetical protein
MEPKLAAWHVKWVGGPRNWTATPYLYRAERRVGLQNPTPLPPLLPLRRISTPPPVSNFVTVFGSSDPPPPPLPPQWLAQDGPVGEGAKSAAGNHHRVRRVCGRGRTERDGRAPMELGSGHASGRVGSRAGRCARRRAKGKPRRPRRLVQPAAWRWKRRRRRRGASHLRELGGGGAVRDGRARPRLGIADAEKPSSATRTALVTIPGLV